METRCASSKDGQHEAISLFKLEINYLITWLMTPIFTLHIYFVNSNFGRERRRETVFPGGVGPPENNHNSNNQSR